MSLTMIKVSKKGIIVLPKKIREMFNISEGDTLFLLADKDGIHLLPRAQVVKKFCGILANEKNESMIDALLEERKHERAKEKIYP